MNWKSASIYPGRTFREETQRGLYSFWGISERVMGWIHLAKLKMDGLFLD